ncbi:MAG: urease accessory protein UreF [Pikeienuella sp.]
MDQAAIAKLAAWLSPAYPVGAFAYSHGLEWAIGAGEIADAPTLEVWIGDLIAHGAGRSDAILLARAHAMPLDQDPAALAAALQPSAERHAETMNQGAAFAETTAAAWGPALAPAPYPVAIGRASAAHGIPVQAAAALYLQGFASNLVSVGIRLIPIGQTAGQQVLAALMPLIQQVAEEAVAAPITGLGGAAFRADIASMRHETQRTRLFRS